VANEQQKCASARTAVSPCGNSVRFGCFTAARTERRFGDSMFKLDFLDFGRRMAVEREIDSTAAAPVRPSCAAVGCGGQSPRGSPRARATHRTRALAVARPHTQTHMCTCSCTPTPPHTSMHDLIPRTHAYVHAHSWAIALQSCVATVVAGGLCMGPSGSGGSSTTTHDGHLLRQTTATCRTTDDGRGRSEANG
jgi:hypothetical protein